MDTIMAPVDAPASLRITDDLDELYGRYSVRLLAAAAEQLAALGPAADQRRTPTEDRMVAAASPLRNGPRYRPRRPAVLAAA
ncbi:hypothetical protein ACWC5I_41155 [Kitasatospora sp. NPDC001574]